MKNLKISILRATTESHPFRKRQAIENRWLVYYGSAYYSKMRYNYIQ